MLHANATWPKSLSTSCSRLAFWEALPLWEDEIQRPELFGNPALIENIRRDGVKL
jgi:hypothetical protein